MRQYQALTLVTMLNDFKRDRFTGIVSCVAKYDAAAKTAKNYFLIFRLGEITYGDVALPNVARLSDLLMQQLNHPLMPTATKLCQEQCDNPGSMREFLTRFVATKVVTWEQVETVVHNQTQAVIQEIVATSGMLAQTPGDSIDICFGHDGHALNWSLLMAGLPSETVAPSQDPVVASPVAAKIQVPSTVSETSAPLTPSVASPSVAPSSVAPSSVASSVASSSQPTVLSVDDSPIAQKMLKRSLDAYCNMLLANSAMDALKLLNSNSEIELVFLDVNMPGVDGLEFCKAVRSIPKFKELPIIMLTANEGLVNKVRGQIAGSTLYINKSVEPSRLVEILHQYTNVQGSGSTSSSSGAANADTTYSLK